MLKLKKSIIVGFTSIVQETKFKWNRPGLNIIIGDNGAGKTTCFSALYWCLYGKTLKGKGVKTWEWLQPKDYKGTMVHTFFKRDNIEYEVIRCKDYKNLIHGAKGNNRLILIENGVVSSIRDIKPLQARINKILGYSDTLFVNTTLFGDKLGRIIESSGPEKKKVFEEAFESGFIKDAKEKAEAKLKTLKPQLEELSKEVDQLKAKKDKLKSNIALITEQKDDWEKEHNARLKSLWDKCNQQIDITKTKFTKDYEAAVMEVKRLETKLVPIDISQLKSDLFKAERKWENAQGDFEDLEKEKDTLLESYKNVKKSCPICGAVPSEKSIKRAKADIKVKLNKVKDKITRFKKTISQYSKPIEAIKEQIASAEKNLSNELRIKNKLSNYKSIIKAYNEHITNVSIAKSKLTDLRMELELEKLRVFKDNSAEYKTHLKEVKTKLKPQLKLLKAMKKERADLEWVIGDALGNKGLKAYIFDTMLKGLNEKLVYYEQYIGYRVEFNVDLDSANKDIYTLCYIGENMIDFEDLSRGQQKTVNICTIFALHDLVAGDKPINLQLFDEIFDGLDAEHTDLVSDLLNDKAQEKSIYLISHNIDLQSSSTKVIKMHLDSKKHTVLKTLSS